MKNSSQVPTGDWLREEQPEELLDGYYCPLYVEPMVGSEERICIAVAAATPEGFFIAPSPGLDRFRCFYDEGAEFLLRLIEEVRFDMEAAFGRDRAWKRFGEGEDVAVLWKSPFEGFHVGKTTWATGKNAGEIADIGLMMCSSLTAKVELSEQERQETLTRHRLIAQVRSIVSESRDWNRFFDVSFPGLSKTRFDFVGQRLAAHIGVLMPDHRREGVDATKVGAVDLFTLRANSQELFSNSIEEKSIESFCVFLHLQAERAKSKRQREEMERAQEGLRATAQSLGVRVVSCATPSQIATRLIELEAA